MCPHMHVHLHTGEHAHTHRKRELVRAEVEGGSGFLWVLGEGGPFLSQLCLPEHLLTQHRGLNSQDSSPCITISGAGHAA